MPKKQVNEHGLDAVEEKFCHGILRGLTQADALREAHPLAKGWADATVWVKASAMASRDTVRVRIAALRKAQEEQEVITTREVHMAYRHIALSDPAGLVKVLPPEEGQTEGRVRWLLPHELAPEIRAAIASVKVDDLGRVEYRFWPKVEALRDTARMKGMFEKDNEQGSAVGALRELLGKLSGNVLAPAAGSGLPDPDDHDGDGDDDK